MTAHNFSKRFDMTMDEAQKFVDDFKKGLPVLFNWIAGIESKAQKEGTISTYFGRPRRVKSWFDMPDWSWNNFAKRTAVNTVVQGTGADILKIVMIRIFNKFYINNGYPMTELVRFKNTIHDEINYQIIKDKEHNFAAYKKILKMIMQRMRVQQPEWEFPMEIGLSIGNRWGQSVDFDFDKTTLDIIGPKAEKAEDNDICKGLGIIPIYKGPEAEIITDKEQMKPGLGGGYNNVDFNKISIRY